MNQLSWLIYAAGVVDSINQLLTIIFVPLVVVTIGSAIAWTIMQMDGYFEDSTLSTIVKTGSTAAKWAVATALVAAPLPDKETVYAIAASEMGEKLLNTRVAGKAEQALSAWLDKQITEATKKDDDK